MRSLLVYCGSSTGSKPVYRETAGRFGTLMAKRNIRLVYGGGSIGLMGILADSVLKSGGEVTGVIPDFLNALEVAHRGVEDMRIVKSMHERKALMEQLSEAVVALPGGYGTLDELFEILTWAQLGLHDKPVGLLNLDGYFDHLIAQADHMLGEGFISERTRALLLIESDAEKLLDRLQNARPGANEQWMDRSQV